MRCLDLFSGIGGFSLGLERAGMETVAFCEYDKKAQLVLKKHWPDVPMFDDVRTLTGEQLERAGITDIGLICGGYPCQPFSVAGKRQGKADDRHLWPEFFRLIKEIRPTWIIAENVAGHINMGLDSVLADLESESYQCQTFLIPACAVSAFHRRDRVWIVAHSNAKCGASAKQKRQHEGAEDSSGSGANRLDAWADVAYSEKRAAGNVGQDFRQGSGEINPPNDTGGVSGRHDKPRNGEVVAHSESARREARRSNGMGNDDKPRGDEGQSSGCSESDVADPSASDNRDGGQLRDPAMQRRIEREEVGCRCSESGVNQATGSLNPQWVEWLMGFPDGWTDLNS